MGSLIQVNPITTSEAARCDATHVTPSSSAKNPGGWRLCSKRRKYAALAVPGNPRPEGQGDCRGLVLACVGRAGRTTLSVWRTDPSMNRAIKSRCHRHFKYTPSHQRQMAVSLNQSGEDLFSGYVVISREETLS